MTNIDLPLKIGEIRTLAKMLDIEGEEHLSSSKTFAHGQFLRKTALAIRILDELSGASENEKLNQALSRIAIKAHQGTRGYTSGFKHALLMEIQDICQELGFNELGGHTAKDTTK